MYGCHTLLCAPTLSPVLLRSWCQPTSVYAKRSPLAISGEFKQIHAFMSGLGIKCLCRMYLWAVLHSSAESSLGTSEPESAALVYTIHVVHTPTHNSQILLFVRFSSVDVFSCAFAWQALRILDFTSSVCSRHPFVIFLCSNFFSSRCSLRFVVRFLPTEILQNVFFGISCCEYHLHNTPRRKTTNSNWKFRVRYQMPNSQNSAGIVSPHYCVGDAACRAPRRNKVFVCRLCL